MVLVQKWPFFQLFFLGNIGQENVFYDILERKNAFLGYKKKKLKKSKNWHFSKSFNSRFFSKNDHFSNIVFFRQYRPGKCLLRYSWTKNPFSRLWNKKLRSRKIDIFPKGLTHGFSRKMTLFTIFFFFRQYRPGKCLLRYSRRKKRLSRL